MAETTQLESLVINLLTKEQAATATRDANQIYMIIDEEELFTQTDKNKLDGIEEKAQQNVQSDWNAASGDAFIKNKPNIPSKTSELNNDSGFLTEHQDISGKADKVHTHDERYYTETEIDVKLSGKSDSTHNHDTTYSKLEHEHEIVDIKNLSTSLNDKISYSEKGAANGVAQLDNNGKVPSQQLPVLLSLGETSSSAYRGDRGKEAYDHSQSAHARTDATKVEGSTINGNIKINNTETNVYTHPVHTAKSSGLYKITIDSSGHVSSVSSVSKTDITGLGIPEQDTVYTHPTTAGNKHIPAGGSIGQILENTANGVAEWVNKPVVDANLNSTSTNAVQNKVVYTAIEELSSKISEMLLNADIAFDTFKEISDWIQTHENEYDALVGLSNNKVDKVAGKGLSTEDFTTVLLDKLNGIADGANKYIHPSYTEKNIGMYKIVVDVLGHISSTEVITKKDITDLGISGDEHNHDSLYSKLEHKHEIADVNDLTIQLSTKLNSSEKGALNGVASLQNGKVPTTQLPNTMPPSEHTHDQYLTEHQDISGKADKVHTHNISDVTNLETQLGNKINNEAKGVANGVATLGADGKIPESQLPSTGGNFDFDTYSNMTGYVYGYVSSTKTETITKDGTTFATRANVKNTDGTWTVTISCSSMNFNSKKKWAKDASGNWSATDIT